MVTKFLDKEDQDSLSFSRYIRRGGGGRSGVPGPCETLSQNLPPLPKKGMGGLEELELK